MVQDIAPPLTRQLESYRHQAVAAPTLLDYGTLAPSHVTQVLTQEGVAGRNRLFPPHLTLWTFLLQVLSPDGSCREAQSQKKGAIGHHPHRAGSGPITPLVTA